MRRFSRVEPQPRLDVPPLTENVRKMLHDAGLESITATLSNESQMPVPISILETLAAKVSAFPPDCVEKQVLTFILAQRSETCS